MVVTGAADATVVGTTVAGAVAIVAGVADVARGVGVVGTPVAGAGVVTGALVEGLVPTIPTWEEPPPGQ
jgi:hypothetical protein